MVDATAVVGQAIGDNQIGRFVYVIIAGNLVEYRLGQGDVGSFTFDDQKRLSLSIKNNNIRTLLGLVENQTTFGADERFRVGVVC